MMANEPDVIWRAWHSNALGNAISGRRRQHGMTQQALAAKMGVSPGLVSQWELGKTKVPSNDLPRLAQALGITAVELISDTQIIDCKYYDQSVTSEDDEARLKRQEQILLSKFRLLSDDQREMAIGVMEAIRVAERIDL